MNTVTDMTFLNSFTGGDKQKVSKYVGMFLNLAPGQLEKMTSHLDKQEYEEVKVVAHSLKPQFNYMGIKSLEDTIKTIEDYAGHEKNVEQLPGLVAHVQQVCDSAFDELKQYV